MIKKLNKTGRGSKCILIDKSIIDLLNIDTHLKLDIENGKIILTPIKKEEGC